MGGGGGGGGGGWGVGSAGNRASSAPIELGLGLSLAQSTGYVIPLNSAVQQWQPTEPDTGPFVFFLLLP